MTEKIASCSCYKKVTVITDPNNPEEDLMDKANAYGKLAASFTCSDGFVLLMIVNEDETNEQELVE